MIISILSWLTLRRWWLLGAFYVFSVGGVFIKTWAWRDNVCDTRNFTTIIQGEKYHDKKEKQIRSLSNDALVRRYCHWVYDMPYNECVRSIIPIE